MNGLVQTIFLWNDSPGNTGEIDLEVLPGGYINNGYGDFFSLGFYIYMYINFLIFFISGEIDLEVLSGGYINNGYGELISSLLGFIYIYKKKKKKKKGKKGSIYSVLRPLKLSFFAGFQTNVCPCGGGCSTNNCQHQSLFLCCFLFLFLFPLLFSSPPLIFDFFDCRTNWNK